MTRAQIVELSAPADATISPRRRGRRPPASMTGPIAAVVLALLAILVILFAPKKTPSLTDAVALATRSANGPAAIEPGASAYLTAHVGSIHLPARLAEQFVATGQRTDRIDGRPATTVFYRGPGMSLAYSIVAASLQRPHSGLQDGIYSYLTVGRRTVVTWRSGAVTRVISGGSPVSVQLLSKAAQ